MYKLHIDDITRQLEALRDNLEGTISFVIIGGLAMQIYMGETSSKSATKQNSGYHRVTNDLDAEVSASEKDFNLLLDFLHKRKIPCNIGEDIDRWGIAPMPKGYRERARTIREDKITIRVLHPVDFIYSKLRRSSQEDIEDIKAIISHYGITKEDILKMKELIRFPKDEATLLFNKIFEHLMENELFSQTVSVENRGR